MAKHELAFKFDCGMIYTNTQMDMLPFTILMNFGDDCCYGSLSYWYL